MSTKVRLFEYMCYEVIILFMKLHYQTIMLLLLYYGTLIYLVCKTCFMFFYCCCFFFFFFFCFFFVFVFFFVFFFVVVFFSPVALLSLSRFINNFNRPEGALCEVCAMIWRFIPSN